MLKNNKTMILLGFILLKFFLQYILISPEYELHRDEYLYLDQANHLAFGYVSVPPLTSWISFIIQAFGNTVFWVKFFPALFGALTIFVVWKSIEELNGDLYALILGATCVLLSAILRINTLYQPNSLDILCWITLYFAVIKYINTENPKWLYIGALVCAIAFLNKYTIVFLLLGLVPGLIITKQRQLLFTKHLLFAFILGILLVLPNLIWQYNNQFPVFHHLKELSEKHLVNVNRWDFFKSQVLFFTGSLVVILSALYALIFYPPYKKYQAFFFTFLFTLFVFAYFRAKDYYAIGLYPVYIAFGATYLENIFARKLYLQLIVLLIPIVFFVPFYAVAFPNKSPAYIIAHAEMYKRIGLLRWEDGKDHPLPQDFADMLGWQELAQKVDEHYASLPNPEKTLVLCDNYGQAGAINYFTTQGIRAVSFHADYINWFELEKEYLHFIRVKSYSERYDEFEKTSPYFETSFVADSITNEHAREFGTTIFVFINSKIDINKRIKTELEQEKCRNK